MMSDVSLYFIGFLINFMVAFALVRWIYYPSSPVKSHVFTFLAFNTIIYFVISILTDSEMGVGIGFGLFAIFSLLRYRTDPIPIREMTYLFIIVALPVMNSAATSDQKWLEMILANGIVLIVLWILEKEWRFRYEVSKTILYEKIDLIVPERYPELIADLEKRTGLKIKRARIGKLDFMRDTATIEVFTEGAGEKGLVKYNSDSRISVKSDMDDDD